MTTTDTRAIGNEASPDATSGDSTRVGPVSSGPAGRALWRRWLVVDVLLGVLVLAALAAAAFTARGVLADRAQDEARDDALAAARQLAVSFTSLDYRTYDHDAKRVLAQTGGGLAEQFSAESAALKKAMTTNRSVTKGQVLEAAVVDADRDSARVLLAVDAQVTNTSTTEPAARHYRIQLDLRRDGGRWVGTDLSFVG